MIDLIFRGMDKVILIHLFTDVIQVSAIKFQKEKLPISRSL